MRVLALSVFRARSRFSDQKRSLLSVNALVVIGQEPSIYAGLYDSGLHHDVSNFWHGVLFHALSASSANSAPMVLGWNSLISDCQPGECH